MSLFKKEESSLGIDLGAGGMKLVELRKVKGRPQLWTYGMIEEKLDVHAGTSSGEDQKISHFADLVRALVEQSRATTKHVTASLPVSQVFHAVITLPPVPPKDITPHINAKVAKM